MYIIFNFFKGHKRPNETKNHDTFFLTVIHEMASQISYVRYFSV